MRAFEMEKCIYKDDMIIFNGINTFIDCNYSALEMMVDSKKYNQQEPRYLCLEALGELFAYNSAKNFMWTHLVKEVYFKTHIIKREMI